MKKAPFLPVLIGTGFGSGFSPFAPGTAGALLASIIWIALYLLLPFSVEESGAVCYTRRTAQAGKEDKK